MILACKFKLSGARPIECDIPQKIQESTVPVMPALCTIRQPNHRTDSTETRCEKNSTQRICYLLYPLSRSTATLLCRLTTCSLLLACALPPRPTSHRFANAPRQGPSLLRSMNVHGGQSDTQTPSSSTSRAVAEPVVAYYCNRAYSGTRHVVWYVGIPA